MKRINIFMPVVASCLIICAGCGSTSGKIDKTVSDIDLSLIPGGNGDNMKYYVDFSGERTLEFKGKTEFGYTVDISFNLFSENLALIAPRQGYSDSPSWFIGRDGNTVITTTDIAEGKVAFGGFYGGMAFIINRNSKETVAIDPAGKELFRLDGMPVSVMYGGFAVYTDTFSRYDSGYYGAINSKGEIVFEPGNKDEYIWFHPNPSSGIYPYNPAHPTQYPVVNGNGELLYVIDLADGKHYLEDVDWSEPYGYRSRAYPMLDWNNLAVCREDGKYGLVDDKGNWVVEPQFDGMVNDGEWYIVMSDTMFGWCDKTGKMQIEAQFECPSRYSGSIPFETRFGADKWAYVESIGAFIDRKGEVALDCEYMPLTNFVDDRCIVELRGHRGYAWMGRDGELISDPFGIDDEEIRNILSQSTRYLLPPVKHSL